MHLGDSKNETSYLGTLTDNPPDEAKTGSFPKQAEHARPIDYPKVMHPASKITQFTEYSQYKLMPNAEGTGILWDSVKENFLSPASIPMKVRSRTLDFTWQSSIFNINLLFSMLLGASKKTAFSIHFRPVSNHDPYPCHLCSSRVLHNCFQPA
jgi:hypothetical protein